VNERDRIDPASREPLEQLLQAFPGGFNAIADIEQRRHVVSGLLTAMTADVPPRPNVVVTNLVTPGPPGAPEVEVRVYRPTAATNKTAGLLFIHGGGMILGDLDSSHLSAEMLCDVLGITIVSTNYRKAPEHPHPSALDDCYASLEWMSDNADDLGIDRERMGVFGLSAGGNLCLATAMRSRDAGGPPLRFIMPIYPMIDPTHSRPSTFEITDVGIWDRSGNVQAWEWFLGGAQPDAYAAPIFAENLTGLPPTFMDVGTVDLFRDEDIEFAARLARSGVPTEFRLYPGAYHASEVFAPEAPLSQRIWAGRIAALKAGLCD